MKGDIPNIFTRDFQHLKKVEMFRQVLYVVLLLNSLSLLPIAYELFGYHGLIGTRGWNTGIPTLKQGTYAFINVLSHPANSKYDWLYLVFVFGQIAFLVTGLLKLWPRISAILVFFFTINLFLKGYLAFTGGEVLVNLMLFYLMFVHAPKGIAWSRDLQNILNNTFYWILIVQICCLYFFSAAYKFLDADWVSGYAVMYISRIGAFKSFFTDFSAKSYTISAVLTYLALAYQILFPLVVWFKKFKIPFLSFGVLFHLGIAFGMGLFTFGMIMIVVYILFLDEEQLEWMNNKFKKSKIVT